jgi:hypothetical protein
VLSTHTHTKQSMACKLPHTAEQFQLFIKAEAENSDVDRQNAIVKVILKFEVAKQLKQRLRERYVECTDISDDRKYVIDTFLHDEYRKDAAVIESLWACVHQIENQISNKIRWSFKENVEAARVEQQQQQQPPQNLPPPLQQGASSSSTPRVVVQQQQLPHLDNFQPSFEENVARELSRLEAQIEEERLASFDPYDDGYDSNNSQTWDHPDYH